MAHRGKHYAVAFRRDWNLNVNNNNIGFAAAYNFHYSSLTVSAWPGLRGAVFVCTEQPATATDVLEWLSDYLSADGYQWRVRLQQHLTLNAPATLQPVSVVERSDRGEVYRAKLRIPAPESNFAQDLSAATLYWDTAVYPSDPAIYLSSIQNRDYSGGDYP